MVYGAPHAVDGNRFFCALSNDGAEGFPRSLGLLSSRSLKGNFLAWDGAAVEVEYTLIELSNQCKLYNVEDRDLCNPIEMKSRLTEASRPL